LKNINIFLVDRKETPEEINKVLFNFIENFLNEKDFSKLLIWLSRTLSVPKDKLEHDCKSYLHENFIIEEGKFNSTFKFKKIFFSSIKYFIFFIWISFFKKSSKNKKELRVDIIVDLVLNNDEVRKFLPLKENFKDVLFISHTNLNANSNFYIFDKYKKLQKTFLFSKIPYLFFLGFLKIVFVSIKKKTNLIPLILNLIKTTFKYESLFSEIKADYLIQERIYRTSAIKQFLFHKHGGKITSVIQKNLPQVLGQGTFCIADYFFSLGKKTHTLAIKAGGNFKKIIPVGSVFMETVYFKKKRNPNIPSYDLVLISSPDMRRYGTHYDFVKCWHEHFIWLNKFSIDYPEKSVALKYKHDNPKYTLTKNKFFQEVFKNSNVKITNGIDDESKRYSYEYAFNAKAVCAFQSTVGFEIIGHGKPCIFMDPGGKNTAFLPNDDFYSQVKVKTYEEFVKEVFNVFEGKSIQSNLNSENYCLKSENVIKRICESLKS